MRIGLLLGLLLLVSQAQASVWIEGVYGKSEAPASGLNAYRKTYLWNGTTATDGELKNPDYIGASLGGSFLFHTRLSFRYENQTQHLQETVIPTTGYTVSDSFNYEPLYALLELPIHFGAMMFTIGGGAGYALTYQFHQKLSNGTGEDVIWQAHPIAARARATLGFRLFGGVGVFAEVNYENVKSSLKADKDYKTTVSGQPIAINQELKDANGKPVSFDLSGFRYGLGLRLMF